MAKLKHFNLHEDHPPSVIVNANIQNSNQMIITAEVHSASLTLDLPIMVNEGTEIVSLPVCFQHENEVQEAIATTDLSAVALQEVEKTDIGLSSEYWNTDVESMFLPKVETPVNTKKKVGLSSSRILTSTEVIQAKKDMASFISHCSLLSRLVFYITVQNFTTQNTSQISQPTFPNLQSKMNTSFNK